MLTDNEYEAPTPEAIADFCDILRDKMTEAAKRATLEVNASFGDHELVKAHPDDADREPDGSWTVTIRAGATQ